MLLRLLGNLWRRTNDSPPPADVGARELLRRAEARQAGGDTGEAIMLCERALALEPGYAPARQLLVGLELPGATYRELLRRMHDYLRPRTYVEIGVSRGDTITLVGPETVAIGIDPEPKIKHPLTARTRIFAETSDNFFARRDLGSELAGLPVDLAFIDGLHHFEFALRDFINLERHCARASTIMIHDCYPLDEATARRERVCEFWSGDIWKLVVCLKKYRPDLHIHTIGCAPTGLAVVNNLDPASTVLPARLLEICDEFIPLPFAAIAGRKAELLNRVANDWERIRLLLAPRC